ncbi:hypothetical protein BFJ66_g15407 [Fusarium oxysporum f. sp. cepae]|uniref:Ketopantoate reductase N-terminal domain-containing protein n=1 Tax=Fusarium oxysporum f. sp. cepae TaxID=396571 RepID=A0A3L6NSP9_FUSOX|nr:hypothetical protein BFJ65_g7691 [Fusarium oxysporum f. sp. cepae]RKK32366.1 hypothetical protein BFJ66_g15407 [Fusarium oxysporum f. sp. cepae]RKK36948.1 hypothetical protein BFJ67_g12548 [Fusarium oxysporum f. sp. cepae]
MQLNTTVQNDIIDHLIVSVKAPPTEPLKHRLKASSNILFLQNVFGMIKQVNEQVFTDERTRPNYITGVTSHGITLNALFNIIHTGFTATSLGIVPRTSETNGHSLGTPLSSYLLEALPLIPRLNGTEYNFLDIFQI